MTDDLVVPILREIQATIADHTRQLTAIRNTTHDTRSLMTSKGVTDALGYEIDQLRKRISKLEVRMEMMVKGDE